MRLGRPLVACLVLGAASCTELKQGHEAPDGVQCKQLILGGKDGPSLQKALAAAKVGDCIVVEEQTYKGSFEVPQGVTVTSAKGMRATLQGSNAEKPAIAIIGGTGSALCNLSVRDSVGFGISVKGGPVLIKDVVVEKSLQAGLATTCDGCGDDKTIELRDVRLRQNKLGAWFRGGVVTWTGGLSSLNKSPSITGGAGVIGHAGVRLSMKDVTVEQNDAVGVLLDGTGTAATLEGVRVAGNLERGVWAQRLKPKADEIVLRVGGNSVIENNAIVGIGLFESSAIEIQNTTIRGTLLRKVTLDSLLAAEVGDGLLFASSSGRVSDVVLEGNARAAALIDAPASAGITVENPRVTAPGGGYKIVVQNDQDKRAQVPETEVTPAGQVLAFPKELDTAELTTR